MRAVRNAYRISVGKPEANVLDLVVVRRIILKWILG
jgi:hypothetical protein